MTEAKIVRYHCAHCGRDFEAEEKEFIECPGCFWSTSVKRREDADEEKAVSGAEPSSDGQKKRIDFFLLGKFLKRFFTVVAVLAIVMVIGSLVFKWVAHRKSVADREAAVNVQGVSGTVDRKGGREAGRPVFTEDEKAVLHGKVELPATITLTPEQEQILNQQIPLKTGSVEKLPSSPWTEENFKQMLKEQEAFYKVTLARSYKGKLEKGFKEKYLPAQAAFEAGDLVKARDLWVESLIFPIYADDLRKHRGVVLTMLRAFINDTLSKIGAINQSLVEGDARARENELGGLYAQFLEHIKNRAWSGALNAADQLDTVMKDLEQIQSRKGAAPPYPSSIGQVDQDIAAALMDLLNVTPPSVADLAALRQDIDAKRDIIESLVPENIQAQKAIYEEALERIANGEWEEAGRKLSEIRFPEPLVRDARAKMDVLSRIQNTGLDSQKESG